MASTNWRDVVWVEGFGQTSPLPPSGGCHPQGMEDVFSKNNAFSSLGRVELPERVGGIEDKRAGPT